MRVSNATAIALYERLGFESRGIRRGYYTDNREDALIMRKDGRPRPRVILGLETSCDETAAAVVTADGFVRSSVVASQADLHARYGGVVPEVASRRHLELVSPVIRAAIDDAGATLDDVERVAVKQGPGLIGALLVGLAAQALAWSRRLPLAPVDHRPGQIASLSLRPPPLEPPFLGLLVSGGHTLLVHVESHRAQRILGTTLDDAAGEAFDKGARLLGLGYPGGREIDRLARDGDPAAYDFPVARVPGLDFSFSGLKTALSVRDEEARAGRARGASAPISPRLSTGDRPPRRRVGEAAAELSAPKLAVVGGVAAHREPQPLRATLAPLELTTDNAAMIASAARFLEPVSYPGYLGLDAFASR